MSKTAFAGPVIAFGVAASGYDKNPDRGPSMFDQGFALLDPRSTVGYNPGRETVTGWAGTSRLPVLDVVPSATSATNIALAQVPVAGTALTLTAGTGITSGVSITRIDTGATVTGLYAIDSAADTLKYGSMDRIRVWDPTKMLARCLQFTSAGNDSGATFVVRGYDVYGQPMSETVTGANATVAYTAKAWKYITSITPAGTLSGSNVSVGASDRFGFPIRVDHFGDVQIVYNNAAIASVTVNTDFWAAVTTDPATATTGDTRGRYAVPSAMDGNKRLQVFITPKPANLETTAGLIGVTQYTA